MIKAVLFDYDGVLADTMGDLFKGWRHSFKRHANIEIKKQDHFALEGKSALEIAKNLCRKYKVSVKDFEALIKDKDSYYFKNNNFKIYEGMKEIINFLKKKGLKVAIVSGGSRPRIKKMTGARLFNKFDIVLAAGDVKRGKPFPDPYLKALKLLKISPEEAIIVENAPLGVKAAKAAGVFCIALETTLDKTFLKEADVVVKDVQNLLLYLKKSL